MTGFEVTQGREHPRGMGPPSRWNFFVQITPITKWIRYSSKWSFQQILDYFLWSNESNIDQYLYLCVRISSRNISYVWVHISFYDMAYVYVYRCTCIYMFHVIIFDISRCEHICICTYFMIFHMSMCIHILIYTCFMWSYLICLCVQIYPCIHIPCHDLSLEIRTHLYTYETSWHTICTHNITHTYIHLI